MRLLSALAAVLGIAALAAGAVGATGSQGPSRLVDQSFVCEVDLVGGVREIELRAHAGLREPGASGWKQLPFAAVSTGTLTYSHLRNALAFVTAGAPSATTSVGTGYDRVEVREWGTIARRASRCRPTRTSVPLSRKGLPGGKLGALEDAYECQGHPRVLVRLQAALRDPARLRPRNGLLATSVPARTARMMIRTQNGRPLAYAATLETGVTRLFVSRACTPD